MITNNWREEFDKQFSSVWDLFSFEPIKDFIETQIAQAREEWRQEWYAEAWKAIDSMSF